MSCSPAWSRCVSGGRAGRWSITSAPTSRCSDIFPLRVPKRCSAREPKRAWNVWYFRPLAPRVARLPHGEPTIMANPNQNQQNQNDPQRGGQQQSNPGREQQGGGQQKPGQQHQQDPNRRDQ